VADHFANLVGFAAPWHSAADEMGTAADGLNGRIAGLGDSYEDMALRLAHSSEETIPNAVANMGTKTAEAITDAAPGIAAATDTWRVSSAGVMTKMAADIATATAAMGKDAGKTLALGLLDSLPNVHSAWDAYKTAAKNALDPMKEITWLESRLAGDKLAQGLNSKNPLTRAAAETMRDQMQAELDNLKTLMGTDAAEGSTALANNLDGTAALAQAREIMRKLQAVFNQQFRVPAPVVGNNGDNFGGGGRALGGPVQKGVSYIVGEKGPEIFQPTQNGYIHPNQSGYPTSRGALAVGRQQMPNVMVAPRLVVTLSARENQRTQDHYTILNGNRPPVSRI
jgi:hypothetical protein